MHDQQHAPGRELGGRVLTDPVDHHAAVLSGLPRPRGTGPRRLDARHVRRGRDDQGEALARDPLRQGAPPRAPPPPAHAPPEGRAPPPAARPPDPPPPPAPPPPGGG